jgi:YD repeat-containing protein
MGEETTYQYDGVGNLVQKIDAKNQKTEYIYDDSGRLTQIKYYDPVDPVNPACPAIVSTKAGQDRRVHL